MFVTKEKPELVKVTFTGKGIKAKYMIASKDAIGLIEQFDTAVKANATEKDTSVVAPKGKRTRRTKAQIAADKADAEAGWVAPARVAA